MARQNAVNFTKTGYQFPYATSSGDAFNHADVQVLAQAVDVHDHTSGLGLGAGRVASGLLASRPAAAAGLIYFATDNETLYLSDGSTWTAMDNLTGTQTLQNKTLGSGCTWSGSAINVSSLTGTLPYGNGGTGATSLTQHGVVTAGASALGTVAPGASGNVLASNGTDWVSQAPAAGSVYKLLGKGTATGNQAITGSSLPGTDVTSLTVTCTPDGTHDVRVTVSLPDPTNSVGAVQGTFCLQKDGTVVATAVAMGASSGQFGGPVTFSFIDAAPTNASHTYKVSAAISGGATLNTLNAPSGTNANSIFVEQVG
ncbi:MAG: hypothetical protein KGJ86_00230 [Chloroflexota bacterium]|nr:hypothetical protein [Chloroflexota bacterium]